MGQKVNPTIFRLGKIKNWKSQYFEKKSNEIAMYAFKITELKKFIEKFFQNNGLIVQNCKVSYLNENSLHVFVSYYLTLQSIFFITKVNKQQKIQLVKSKRLKNKKKFIRIKKNIKNYLSYQKLNYNEILNKNIKKKDYKKIRRVIQNEEKSLKIRRINVLKLYKQNTKIQDCNKINRIRLTSLLEKLFKSLQIFLNKNLNIFLTLKQLNTNLKKTIKSEEYKIITEGLVNIKKYEKNDFFKEGVNILYTCCKEPNSADLLATFIATQLKKLKRHKYFLTFIKSTLSIFKSKNIKIKIKGRFNAAPRAKHKIILIGNGVPALTLKSNIDYSEKTSYTLNGTFGIKVWIKAKTHKKQC